MDITLSTQECKVRATLIIMGNSQQTTPTRVHRFAVYGGWVGSFVLAAWILIPRLVIGTTMPIAWVISIALPLILIVIGCVTLGLPAARGMIPTKRSVAWLWFAFFSAFIVGLFMPDDTIFSASNHDQATALVAVLFGVGWEGAGSAIANPAAILMIISGAIGAVSSVLDSRETGPVRTEDEDHMQGHGYFPILGEDKYYRVEDGAVRNKE